MDHLSARLQSSGVSPRSSSRSLVPMRRLNTIEESGSADPHSASPGVDVLDERAPGSPQLPPPRGWVPENQDAPEDGAGNPLLRHSSQGSRGSRRS